MSDLCARTHSTGQRADGSIDDRSVAAGRAPASRESFLQVDDIGRGMARLAVSQVLDQALAQRIAAILKDAPAIHADGAPFGRRAVLAESRRGARRGVRPVAGG